MDLRQAITAQLAAMQPPITGRCLCVAVRYTCGQSPVWSVNCHCRACQALSGAPFVSAFSVPAGSVTVTGETTAFQRSSDSGYAVTTTHCAACGSRVHAQSAGARHLLNIFAATLDEPRHFRPVSNVYTAAAAHWIERPQVLIEFAGMPRA
jgi:hypothetical protein